MKKLWKLIPVLVIGLIAAFGVAGCAETGNETVECAATAKPVAAAVRTAAVYAAEDGTCEHDYEAAQTFAATCTEQGYTTHTCEICGDSYVDSYTEPTGHTFIWVTDKEATATEAGSKHEECSVCGYKKAAVEIPATGTGTTPDQTKPGDGQGAATTPQTGDNSNMLLWIILCIAAAGALAGTLAYKKIRAERK